MIEFENLKLANAQFQDQLEAEACRIIRSGWYILGDSVAQFEQQFAEWNGNRYCIGTANGFDSLVLSLMAMEFPPHSEILVPANTYIATILAILRAGHKPVLVEPDIKTYNIDPARLKEKITRHTKAIQVVHMYGRACDMQAILEIAAEHGLSVLEDCAQSHGASYQGKKTGTFGVCNSFSFYPTKNLGALGDGGAVVTDDAKLAEKIRVLRNYGSNSKYLFDCMGLNSRLDEIQAAFLLLKLPHLNVINDHKKNLAALYRKTIHHAKITLPATHADENNVYHIFPIRCADRDNLRTYLAERNIKTEIHYPIAPHLQNVFLAVVNNNGWEFNPHEYPISDEIHATELSLPISFGHTEEQIMHVAETINGF